LIVKVLVHVNQHIIRRNKKMGQSEPPITVRRSRKVERCNSATIYGVDGQPAARILYSPDKPLACGARVWIEVLGTISTEGET
jgi:hypothetical protein